MEETTNIHALAVNQWNKRSRGVRDEVPQRPQKQSNWTQRDLDVYDEKTRRVKLFAEIPQDKFEFWKMMRVLLNGQLLKVNVESVVYQMRLHSWKKGQMVFLFEYHNMDVRNFFSYEPDYKYVQCHNNDTSFFVDGYYKENPSRSSEITLFTNRKDKAFYPILFGKPFLDAIQQLKVNQDAFLQFSEVRYESLETCAASKLTHLGDASVCNIIEDFVCGTHYFG